MNNMKAEIPAFLLSLAALVGIVLLSILGQKVPDILNIIAGAALTTGAAITNTRPPTE